MKNYFVIKKYIIKSFNVLGNQIDDNFKGVVIELDSKGGVYKKIKFNTKVKIEHQK